VVGVLVQANHGSRARLAVNGAPVGRAVGPDRVPLPSAAPAGAGSIIVIVATDAPLLPHQCDRLAQRAADAGVAPPVTRPLAMLSDQLIDAYFEAAVEATEEAILNALVAAETMTGRGGATAHALPHDLLVGALERHDALGVSG